MATRILERLWALGPDAHDELHEIQWAYPAMDWALIEAPLVGPRRGPIPSTAASDGQDTACRWIRLRQMRRLWAPPSQGPTATSICWLRKPERESQRWPGTPHQPVCRGFHSRSWPGRAGSARVRSGANTRSVQDGWRGYLTYRLRPENQRFIDGRNEAFSSQILHGRISRPHGPVGPGADRPSVRCYACSRPLACTLEFPLTSA